MSILRLGQGTLPPQPSKRRFGWRPPEDVSTWIFPIDGKYNVNGQILNAHPFALHWVSKGSGGQYLMHRQQQCVPCHAQTHGAKNIKMSHRALMTAYQFGWMHLVDKLNDKGEKYKQYEECTHPHQFCQHCSSGQVDRIYGRRLAWVLGSPDMDILDATAMEIAKNCKLCGKPFYPKALMCPDCGFVFYDLSQIAIDHVTLIQLKGEMKTCPQCSKSSLPHEVGTCQGGCKDPVRASIFNSLLLVKSVRAGKSNFKQLTIMQYELPFDVQARIKADGAEDVFKPDQLKPVDPTMYTKEETPQEQAAVMGIANPFGDMPGAPPPQADQASLFRNYKPQE